MKGNVEKRVEIVNEDEGDIFLDAFDKSIWKVWFQILWEKSRPEVKSEDVGI